MASNPPHLLHLPSELVILIGSFIPSLAELAAFIRTCKYLHDCLIEALYKRGIEGDEKQVFSWAWRHPLGVKSDSLQTLRYSLKVGGDPNFRLSEFEPLLHVALSLGRDEMTLLLLQQNSIDVNIRNHRGETPLMVIASLGKVQLADCLVAKVGRDVNAVADNGETALHFAVIKRKIEIVKLLLIVEEVDMLIVDNCDKCSLDWAIDWQEWDMTKLFRDRSEKQYGKRENWWQSGVSQLLNFFLNR
jgi:ankyrin repeat protein